MNDYVRREEYDKLANEINNLKTQLENAMLLLQASSNLIAPEQREAAYNMYMEQMQKEATQENNARAFH